MLEVNLIQFRYMIKCQHLKMNNFYIFILVYKYLYLLNIYVNIFNNTNTNTDNINNI